MTSLLSGRCFAAILLLAGSAGLARADFRSDQVALAFVHASGAGNNLSQLTFAAAQGTTTYRILVGKFGVQAARLMLITQIRTTAPRYQDRWDTNLAAAYLAHCSAEQLASVARDRQASPSLAYVRSQQAAVGADMHAHSEQLVKDMLTDVLTELFKQVPPDPAH